MACAPDVSKAVETLDMKQLVTLGSDLAAPEPIAEGEATLQTRLRSQGDDARLADRWRGVSDQASGQSGAE